MHLDNLNCRPAGCPAAPCRGRPAGDRDCQYEIMNLKCSLATLASWPGVAAAIIISDGPVPLDGSH
jgi:hypothetical protein